MKFALNITRVKQVVWGVLKYVLLIGIILGLGYLLVSLVYSLTNTPLKVRVSNITGSSATISWVTDRADSGVVLANDKDEFFPWSGYTKGYDDRDYNQALSERLEKITKDALKNVDSEYNSEIDSQDFENIKVTKLGKYYVHHATIFNLNPNTKYYFRVSNGLRSWNINSVKQNIGEYEFKTIDTFSFNTFSEPENIPTPNPAYGKVLSGVYNKDGFIEENLNTDSIVFMYAYGDDKEISNVLSSVTNKDAGWTIDKSNFRKNDGSLATNYYKDNIDYLKISAQVENIKEVYQTQYIWGKNDSPADNILGGVPDKYRGDIFKKFEIFIDEKIMQSQLIDIISSDVYATKSGDVCNSKDFGKKTTEGDYECQCIPGGATGRWSCTKKTTTPNNGGGSTSATCSAATCNQATHKCNAKGNCVSREKEFNCAQDCPYGCLDGSTTKCRIYPQSGGTTNVDNKAIPNDCSSELAKDCTENAGCYCYSKSASKYYKIGDDCRPASCANYSRGEIECVGGDCTPKVQSNGQLCKSVKYYKDNNLAIPVGCEDVSASNINTRPDSCNGTNQTFVPDVKGCKEEKGTVCNGVCYTCSEGSAFDKDLKKCVGIYNPTSIPDLAPEPENDQIQCKCSNIKPGYTTDGGSDTFNISKTENCADYTNKCSKKVVIIPPVIPEDQSTGECTASSGKTNCDPSTGKWDGKSCKKFYHIELDRFDKPTGCAPDVVGNISLSCSANLEVGSSYYLLLDLQTGQKYCGDLNEYLNEKVCCQRTGGNNITGILKKKSECTKEIDSGYCSIPNQAVCCKTSDGSLVNASYCRVDQEILGKGKCEDIKPVEMSKICCSNSSTPKTRNACEVSGGKIRDNAFCAFSNQKVCCQRTDNSMHTDSKCESNEKVVGYADCSNIDLGSKGYGCYGKDFGTYYISSWLLHNDPRIKKDKLKSFPNLTTQYSCINSDSSNSVNMDLYQKVCWSGNMNGELRWSDANGVGTGWTSTDRDIQSCGYCCYNTETKLSSWGEKKCSGNLVNDALRKTKSECEANSSVKGVTSVLGVGDNAQSLKLFPEAGIYSIKVDGKDFKYSIPNTDSDISLYVEKDGYKGLTAGDELIDLTSEDIIVEKISSNFKLNLKRGINIVSFPAILSSDGSKPMTAGELLKLLNFNGNFIKSISYFEGGKWVSGIGVNESDFSKFIGNDFTLVLGRGYLLQSNFDFSMDIPALNIKSSIPVALSSGWNLVGVNGYTTTYTAKSFIDSINSVGGLTADNVTWWPTSKGKYEGLQVSDGTTYGFDFPISRDLGYFVRIVKFEGTDNNTKSIIWNPGGSSHGKPGSN